MRSACVEVTTASRVNEGSELGAELLGAGAVGDGELGAPVLRARR